MDNNINQLKSDGIAKGLCRQWQMKLREDLSVKDLAKLYIQGIDFCIKENYPTLDFLREHYKGKCEPYGVFVDDTVADPISLPQIVLNGQTDAVLEYGQFTVSEIYVRHQSLAVVNVSGCAYVTINVYDQARLVVAVSGSTAKVIVNRFGNASVDCIGDGITLINKNRSF